MLTLPFVIFLFLLGRVLERFTSPAVAWGLTLAWRHDNRASGE